MNLANFRELGGLKNKEGRQVKHNRLLRSGEVFQINETSRDVLKKHELNKIIDLRGEHEISTRPDDELDAVSYHWIDIMKEVHDNGSMEDLLDMSDTQQVSNHMKNLYTNLIVNEGAQQGYREYFEELLKTESGSVLFHCFAGKDRTGVAAALTLEFLDVPRETIYEDYLKTNVQRQKPNEIFLKEAAERGMTEGQLAGVKVAMEVEKAYLDHAYQLIDENFGDVKSYGKEILRLSSSDYQLLKQMYLD
ncbi:protein tyrosine phosphatase [Enterococcus sp. JM4C]|uniref:tyrosine-protein phosphatase n=1 Tax=Candidatus Enterococcus huntleyi TaxID=1857217 RepID=UPI00137A5AA5|nr:tyrosine-protein phosphatase [Enterococcus sp. JM4C]KAF1299200.1 protein tyrosine phosphatase [Enterococcus sp. JM4C]